MSSELGSPHRPLRVAIVGSGPSGFYAAEALALSALTINVDMFERLPAPFGLVRYGVAPDHDKIKNVIKIYEKVAAGERFSFFGNVHIGRDISAEELRKFYDAVIFACGAESDRRLGIPGEDLPGSHTATEFVAWYNGHPDYRGRTFDLSGEVAVVIGQGNVAIDVSRILCKTAEELKNTDIAQYALEALAKSKIKEIHMIGRRGPVQAAFTPAEIKEFAELKDCDPIVKPQDLQINPESKTELEDPDNRLRARNWDILCAFAGRLPSSRSRKCFIHFLKSPVELIGKNKVEKVIFEKNQLHGMPGRQKAEGTGEKEALPCGIFFRSVGYHGVPISGIPFDEQNGIFPNKEGRILDKDKIIPGLYAVGWIKRGPSGVIGTNKPDSMATVQSLLSDVSNLAPCAYPAAQAIKDFLKQKNIKFVDFNGWKKIDAAEIARGQALGKPREKFVNIGEMLNVIA